MHVPDRETILCPLCAAERYSLWATENGFSAVTCSGCGLIYVNPRPSLLTIDQAVRAGAHSAEAGHLNVVARRVPGKVTQYRKIVSQMFADVIRKQQPISWLDVGAGFGEVVEAVAGWAPPGSCIEGLEPMTPKVADARARGLKIREGYLGDVQQRYGFVSIINVFSHVPDFRQFLGEIRNVMDPGAEILLETGNAADIGDRRSFPGELVLPDHLVFAGERHVCRYLQESGFEIVEIRRLRIDGLVHFLKSVVKRIIGRSLPLRLPYTSPARTILVRARLSS
jgi:SAM-dependent methyltransferase